MTAPMIAKLALLAATSHALAPSAVTSVIREKLAEVEEPAALDLGELLPYYRRHGVGRQGVARCGEQR